MPFDFSTYQKKCNVMTKEQLQKEWENYTRQIAAGATGTAASVLLMPYTGGLSAVGLGVSAPRIHNARKKREIIEASLQAQGASPHTRKRDVITAMGVSGAVSGLTLGVVAPGVADVAAGAAFHHGVEYAATQAAFGGSGAVLVHASDQLIRSNDSQGPQETNSLDYSAIQGEDGESVYNMRPHPSHSWSFDSASTSDTLRTGLLATPFAEDESVLFHPILEENEQENQVFSEPINSGIYQAAWKTDAQQELIRKMEVLQLEMQKRQTYAQSNSSESSQPLNQDNLHAYGNQTGPGNGGSGLGIMSAGQYYPAQITGHPPSAHFPLQTTYSPRPSPYQRSESLPLTLQSQHHHYPYHESHQQEPLPSYQQHYVTQAPQNGHSHQRAEQTHPPKPSTSNMPDRQDSGYYSVSSTPSLTSISSHATQQYIVSPQLTSPQEYSTPTPPIRHSVADTGLHRHNHVHRQHRASEPSISAISTSTPTHDPIFPPPPPYSQPSITVTTHTSDKDSKDYFTMQGPVSGDSSQFQKLAKRRSQALLKGVNQGWQWAKEFPVPGNSKTKEEAERDYGPPPDIPIAWSSR